jgi:hypothetical protein
LLILIPAACFGVENSDGILSLIRSGILSWQPTIKTACMWIFAALVVIDLTWTFGKMALTGFEFGEFVFTLIKKIIFIGIIIFLFDVEKWTKWLFEGFVALSGKVNQNSVPITPNTVLSQAISIVMIIINSIDLNIPESFLKIISALLMLVAFAFMAIDLMIVYIKFFLMVVITYFSLAISGIEHFKSMGFNPILSFIKVGIEVFMLQSLMRLMFRIMNDSYLEMFNGITRTSIIQILVTALIFTIITKMVSSAIEAVFQGGIGDTATGASGFKQVMAMTGSMAVGAAAGAIGATRAIQAAKDLHIAEGGKGSGMDMIKGVAKNLATTAGEHLRDNLSRGRMPNDIANRLQEKIKAATSASSDSSSGTISSGSSDAASNDEPYVSGVNNA